MIEKRPAVFSVHIKNVESPASTWLMNERLVLTGGLKTEAGLMLSHDHGTIPYSDLIHTG
jgi:hypothetical protein